MVKWFFAQISSWNNSFNHDIFSTKNWIGHVILAYKVSTKKLLFMLDVWAGYRLTSCYGLFIVPFVFGCDLWKAEPRMFA